MGYRCTFVTDDMPRKWSDKFKEKWGHCVNFDQGCLSSKVEMKGWWGLIEDIQAELKVATGVHDFPIYMARVWEDGRVDQVWITAAGHDYGSLGPEPQDRKTTTQGLYS